DVGGGQKVGRRVELGDLGIGGFGDWEIEVPGILNPQIRNSSNPQILACGVYTDAGEQSMRSRSQPAPPVPLPRGLRVRPTRVVLFFGTKCLKGMKGVEKSQIMKR